jgi:hypothetical protein
MRLDTMPEYKSKVHLLRVKGADWARKQRAATAIQRVYRQHRTKKMQTTSSSATNPSSDIHGDKNNVAMARVVIETTAARHQKRGGFVLPWKKKKGNVTS